MELLERAGLVATPARRRRVMRCSHCGSRLLEAVEDGAVREARSKGELVDGRACLVLPAEIHWVVRLLLSSGSWLWGMSWTPIP